MNCEPAGDPIHIGIYDTDSNPQLADPQHMHWMEMMDGIMDRS